MLTATNFNISSTLNGNPSPILHLVWFTMDIKMSGFSTDEVLVFKMRRIKAQDCYWCQNIVNETQPYASVPKRDISQLMKAPELCLDALQMLEGGSVKGAG